jgi:hypothetical protein
MREHNHLIKCALCGKTIVSKEIIMEIIDNTSYTFDTNDCVLMFKKFRGIYGSDFIRYCLQLNPSLYILGDICIPDP